MNWSRPVDIKAQVQRLWDRGELLASLLAVEPIFPKRLSFKCPTSAEVADHFDEVRVWIGEFKSMPHCRLEKREIRHRVHGPNSVPLEAWIDSLDAAIDLIGKKRDVARFKAMIDATRQRQPALLVWLDKRPLQALELTEDWSRLLDIVVWRQAHPHPGVYLRQVDIAGIHSKFIEVHRVVLSELLDLALPVGEIDASAIGASQFARRYQFRDKPLRIRFRTLDPAQPMLRGGLLEDITLDATNFARLDAGVSQVFITENEINFLAFPPIEKSLVIWGAGYGFEVFREAHWLSRCRVHYWGDIDTHGFAILDQLRSQFAHVESFLMDRATLMAFESLWGEEERQTLRDLPRLDAAERALYDDLRDNRIRPNLRLEQERIGFGWVETALTALA